jgi:hypothetical protein
MTLNYIKKVPKQMELPGTHHGSMGDLFLLGM